MTDDPAKQFIDAFSHSGKSAGDDHEAALHEAATHALAADNPEIVAAHRQFTRNARWLRTTPAAIAGIALGVAALASVILLLVPARQTLDLMRMSGSGSFLNLIPDTPGPATTDEATRLLLYGDPDATTESARWHALWMSDPENPAWFARYAAARLREDKEVAPDVLADAERIDPDNGFWLLLSASVNTEDILEKIERPEADDEKSKYQWIATDEDEVLRRIAIVHEAAAKPRLERHQREYLQAAIAKIPPADSFLERLQAMSWLASEMNYGTMHLRDLANLTEAAVRIAIERNDRELAASIIRDWHRVTLAIAEDSLTLVDCLVTYVIIKDPMECMLEAAETLGLERELERLQSIQNAITEIEEHRLRDDSEVSQDFENKVSVLGGLSLGLNFPILMDPPPPLSPSVLRPSRRMEYAIAERVLIAPFALLTTLCFAAFGAHWLWAGRMQRAFARRALLLLPGWKLVLLGLAAGAGPMLWYLAITRLTPISWLEWSFHHGKSSISLQWLSLAVMILLLPGLLAGIALEKHAHIFAWRWPGGTKWRFAAAIAIVLALPASGMMLLRESGGLFPKIETALTALWWLSLAAMAFALIASLWSGSRQHNDPQRKSPRRLAAGLLAAYARMLTLPLLAAWFALTLHDEKSWTQRDTVMTIDADSPALTSQESDIQRRLHAQTLEMLGPQWPRSP